MTQPVRRRVGGLSCGGMHACGHRGAGLPREAGGEEIQEQERKHSQQSQIQGKQMARCARSKGGRLNITERGKDERPPGAWPQRDHPLSSQPGGGQERLPPLSLSSSHLTFSLLLHFHSLTFAECTLTSLP